MANKDEVWENAQRSLASLPKKVKDEHLVIREVLASECAWRSTGLGVAQRRLQTAGWAGPTAQVVRMVNSEEAAPEGLTNKHGVPHDCKSEARRRFLQNIASPHEPSPVSLIKPSLAMQP